MTRHFKIGLLVALVVASIITSMALMNINEQPGVFGMIVIGPALPVVFGLVWMFPPPMGESEIGPWDYIMLAIVTVIASLFWGVYGRTIEQVCFLQK